ncbi:MAG: hypothetical protein ACI87E_003503 [Mariniblastus sp.]|jgi:hypothetical protein
MTINSYDFRRLRITTVLRTTFNGPSHANLPRPHRPTHSKNDLRQSGGLPSNPVVNDANPVGCGKVKIAPIGGGYKAILGRALFAGVQVAWQVGAAFVGSVFKQ